jgi:FkbM family methyltransferase
MPELIGAARGFMPEIVTYAQNFEDVLLRRALQDIDDGFYVDVVAFHPSIHSVSWWFYQNGWTGINVEPNEKFFAALACARSRDINLKLAVTGKAGFATLYLCDALSTVREEIAAVHRRNGLDISGAALVEAITLDQLFEAYVQARTVDFLKLDVEGSEGEILDAASFESTRPRILVIESTMPDSQESTWQAWERGLLKKGYLFVWFDGLNRYYVREEDRWRRKCFKVPPNVFDSVRFTPNDPRIKFAEGESVEALRHAIDAARGQVSALGAERDALAAKAGTLDGQLLSARAESDRLASVTGHLERALSNALERFWKIGSERDTLIRQKVEAEGELQVARSGSTRLIAERDRSTADRIEVEQELKVARSEISSLIAERDALAAEKTRLDGELNAIRSANARLVVEHEQEKSRLRSEIVEARNDDSRLSAERDRLTVEIARYQIKQQARTEVVAERDRLAAEAAGWFQAAVAAAYIRRFQPQGRARHLKLMITASGRFLRCSISRSRWERGPRTSLALADRAFNSGQWQTAARCYADVLEHWPNNAAVWVQLGHALKEAGRVADAEPVYRHALQLSPAVGDTHLQLGHALKLQGRASEAAEAYAAALRLDPELEHAYAELLALGWSSRDVENAKAQSLTSDGRSSNAAPRRRFTTLALQRMFQ